jgi:dihydroorotate dehydrogenase electron transfer subunit
MTKLIAGAHIIDKKLLCLDHYFMRLECPDIAAEAQPGQFVNILTETPGVILRRPFSFTRADASKGTFDIIFRVVGDGTSWMASLNVGDKMNVMGPLGNGFSIAKAGDSPCVVGGGVGIPPLLWVIEELHREGKEPLVYLGGREEAHLFGLEEIRSLGYNPVLATEDGSVGIHGFITIPLEGQLRPDDVSQVYVCGRIEMLRTLTRWGAPIAGKIQISMECKMACGFGVCLGCAVAANDGGYLHVCTDGPVFTMDRIRLE